MMYGKYEYKNIFRGKTKGKYLYKIIFREIFSPNLRGSPGFGG